MTDTGPVVKVATFNTAAGNRRFSARGGFSQRFEVDTSVIFHQEICSHRHSDVQDPEHHRPRPPFMWGFGGLVPGCGDPATRQFGNAVRAAFSEHGPVQRMRFATAAGGDSARGAVAVRGRLQGRWTTICSTHLSPGRGTPRDAARRSQQRELLDFVDSVRQPDDAVVVGGDFNSTVASVMERNALGLLRASPLGLIDHIWSTGLVVSSWEEPTSLSDHPVLYAVIDLGEDAVSRDQAATLEGGPPGTSTTR